MKVTGRRAALRRRLSPMMLVFVGIALFAAAAYLNVFTPSVAKLDPISNTIDETVSDGSTTSTLALRAAPPTAMPDVPATVKHPVPVAEANDPAPAVKTNTNAASRAIKASAFAPTNDQRAERDKGPEDAEQSTDKASKDEEQNERSEDEHESDK